MAGSDAEAVTNQSGSPSRVADQGPRPAGDHLGGRPIDLGGLKARALVARLLIDRGLIVSVDRLIDSLWGDHEGEGAEIALRSTISRLRKRLREAGAPDDLIATRAPGYVLEVAAETTDVFAFERMIADGRRQLIRHRPSEAVRVLDEAQSLFAVRPTARCGTNRSPGRKRAGSRRCCSRRCRAAARFSLHPGPPRVTHRRAGDADDRAPDPRAPVVPAHSPRSIARGGRPRRCASTRTFVPHWSTGQRHRARARRVVDGARHPVAGPRTVVRCPAR